MGTKAERPPSDPTEGLKRGLAEIATEDDWLVIADLHLDPLGDERVKAFVAFLEGLDASRRLLILGDLFEVWVGPAQGRLAGSAAVLKALRELSARTPVHLIPGNRDFLLDDSFEASTGVQLHPEGLLVKGHGRRVLFLHGDELCTLDHAYQRMKRILRSPSMRFVTPRLPLPLARWVAGRIRKRSAQVVPTKPSAERSIQPDAVVAAAAFAQADIVCCGHAHEYRDELLGDEGPRWIVLDAWEGLRDSLLLGPENLEVGKHGELGSIP